MIGSPAFFPETLKSIPRWVVWKYVERDGKRTKPPYQATSGKLASTTDARTWATFEVAARRAATTRYWEGPGFVFAPVDDLMGIDLDHCRDPTTGAIDPEALQVVETMNTYTEITPSGTGLHLIFRATLDMRGRHTEKGEVYQAGRFFTMTGQALPGYEREPERRQAEVEAVLEWLCPAPAAPPKGPPARGAGLVGPDWEIIDRVRKNGKYDALWRGDIHGYVSHSEADLALCGHLAFYTGPDAGLVDRLFRQSGLWREKWDERHGDRTYGEMTIAQALLGKSEFYEWRLPSSAPSGTPASEPAVEIEGEAPAPHPFDALVYSGPALLAAQIPEPEWLIERYVARAVMTMLVGIGKIGKSVLGHQACVAGACAGYWLDQAVPATRVLYVNWEDPLGLTRSRAVQQFAPRELPETYLTMQPPWGSSFNEFLAWLDKFVPREGIGLVVIDPLAIAANWKDENDNSEVGPTLRNIQEVAQRTGAAVLVVHHTRKSPGEHGEEVRGGSAIFAGIQGFLSFRRKSGGLYALDTKNKMPGIHGGEHSVLLQRAPHTLTWHVTGEETAQEAEKEVNVEELCAHIRCDPGITRPELEKELGVSEASVRRYLGPLLQSGQVIEGTRIRRENDTGKPPKGLFWNEARE